MSTNSESDSTTTMTVVTHVTREGLLLKLRESLRRDLGEVQARCASSVDTELVWPRVDFEKSLLASVLQNRQREPEGRRPEAEEEERRLSDQHSEWDELETNVASVEKPLLGVDGATPSSTSPSAPLLRHADEILRRFESLEVCPDTSINHGPIRQKSIHVLQELRGLLVELHPSLLLKPTGQEETQVENPDLRRILVAVAALHTPAAFSPILAALRAELQPTSESHQPTEATSPEQILSQDSQIIIGPKGVEVNITLRIVMRGLPLNPGIPSTTEVTCASSENAPNYQVVVKLHWFEPITHSSGWTAAATQAWLMSYLPGQPNESSDDALFQLHLEFAEHQ